MERIREELNIISELGQNRYIPSIENKTNGKVIIAGKEFINLASNDYLNISTNMELREEVNVERLIERFRDMALRDALLIGEHITQEDLFVQIAGVIATEAMY